MRKKGADCQLLFLLQKIDSTPLFLLSESITASVIRSRSGGGLHVNVFEQKMLPAAILFHYLCFMVRFPGRNEITVKVLPVKNVKPLFDFAVFREK